MTKNLDKNNRHFIVLESGPKGQTTYIFVLFESEAEKINYWCGISYIVLKEIHEGCNNLYRARVSII